MDNLTAQIKEIESCNYECEAGYLKNHIAWKQIKEWVSQANENLVKFIVMGSQNYQTGDVVVWIGDEPCIGRIKFERQDGQFKGDYSLGGEYDCVGKSKLRLATESEKWIYETCGKEILQGNFYCP
jgi:hypothetical protein